MVGGHVVLTVRAKRAVPMHSVSAGTATVAADLHASSVKNTLAFAATGRQRVLPSLASAKVQSTSRSVSCHPGTSSLVAPAGHTNVGTSRPLPPPTRGTLGSDDAMFATIDRRLG